MKGLYYVALVAPESIERQVYPYKIYLAETCGTTSALKSPAHITLYPPFSLDDSGLPQLGQVLEQFAAACRPLAVRLDGFGCFAPRTLFIRVAPDPRLADMHYLLQQCMVRAGMPGPESQKDILPFHPHITVGNRDFSAGSFGRAWQQFREKVYQAAFTAASVCLLKHNGKAWDVYQEFSFAT